MSKTSPIVIRGPVKGMLMPYQETLIMLTAEQVREQHALRILI